jgi:hypothetical protein
MATSGGRGDTRIGVTRLFLAVCCGATLAGCEATPPPAEEPTQTRPVDVGETLGSLAAPAMPGGHFWYGDDLAGAVGPTLAGSLDATLQSLVVPLQVSFIGFENAPDPRPDLPGTVGVKKHRPARTFNGYTLLTSLGTDFKPTPACPAFNPTNPACAGTAFGAILVDMSGNVVNEWPLLGFPAKMLPGGHVLGGNLAGGGMPSLIQMDWCRNVVHEWPVPQEAGYARTLWHHDFQRAGSPVGYYAPGMAPSADPAVGTTWLLVNHVVDWNVHDTRAISSRNKLFDDAFHEVDASGNLLWAWHAWEHVDQMGFDAKARAAIDQVYVPGGTSDSTDWTHMNQLARLGPNIWYMLGDRRFHPDNLIFDTRSSGILGIVARYDNPGRWKAGDIVWRVGPNYEYGNREHRLGQIIGPHMTHMIPWGLPGAGNILVFDNGGFSGFGSLMAGLPTPYWPNAFRNFSRVIEFNPITLDVVWEYAAPESPDKFFSTLISGAQRLPNGNTLITQGGSGRVFEVTRAGEIVWDYRSPFRGVRFPGGGGFLGPNAVYRSYRVPSGWVPLGQPCPTAAAQGATSISP